MTQDLARKIDAILDQATQEENLPAGTLQRIALTLKRLGQTDLAQTVADFASLCSPELEFFRTLSNIPTPATTGKLRTVQNWFRNRLTDPMYRGAKFDAPFKIIEGVAVRVDTNLEHLSGPFFIAVAGDFSQGHEWSPENRAYLFSPAQNKATQQGNLELRVLTDAAFKTQVSGEQSKGDRYRISLYTSPILRGDIGQLFEAAVEDMAKFAFGPGSSLTARDAFKKAVESYVPQAHLTAINQISTLTPNSGSVTPLTLENTGR